MKEVCEIIPSRKGNDKIKVHEYLMVKDLNYENIFYYAVKNENQKDVKDVYCVDHNNGPQANNAEVAKITTQINRQAFETGNKPAKIIQDNII
ncbi:845_t:CDS:2, partial [Funneliformis geosporum]